MGIATCCGKKKVVCLGVMLVCFGARLTINFSFVLDKKKHNLPQSPSPPPFISPFPSRSPNHLAPLEA